MAGAFDALKEISVIIQKRIAWDFYIEKCYQFLKCEENGFQRLVTWNPIQLHFVEMDLRIELHF